LLAALRLPPPSRKAASVLTASFYNKKRNKEKSGFVRSRLQQKDLARGGMQSLFQAMLENELLGRGVSLPTPRLALSFQKTAAIFRGRK